MKKRAFLIFLLPLVNGCSSYYANSGNNYYLKSCNGVNLVIPPPLTSNNITHFYDLPPQEQNARVSIIPPIV